MPVLSILLLLGKTARAFFREKHRLFCLCCRKRRKTKTDMRLAHVSNVLPHDKDGAFLHAGKSAGYIFSL